MIHVANRPISFRFYVEEKKILVYASNSQISFRDEEGGKNINNGKIKVSNNLYNLCELHI